MDPRSAIPGVDRLLSLADERGLFGRYPRARVVQALRDAVDGARREVPEGSWGNDPADPGPYLDRAESWLASDARASLGRVVNATGVVLHTNLGRAPLAAVALEAMTNVACGYSNLEFDLEAGARGSRYDHSARLLAELTGAQDALVVNNCAGGLVLALNALARGRDVVVSRGELVEIGGGFRIPEVLEQAGAGLREVGATNRTRSSDYRAAIRAGGVAAILKVHRSNFRISGFTEEASLPELSELALAEGIPLIHDLGSGLLADASSLGLPPEPTPGESLSAGAHLVVFSGDKLLGGPQAGLVAGTSDLVSKLRGSPLCRALRVDKATLAALEATLRLYREPDRALREIPVLAMLSRPLQEVRVAAEELADAVAVAAGASGAIVTVEETTGRVGGGTYPEHPVPSWAVRVAGGAASAREVALRLRSARPPVVARIDEDDVILDLRTVLPGESRAVVDALCAALQPGPGSVDPSRGGR